MIEDPSGTDLVIRAATGDQQAWGALVDRYAPLIWSICRQHRVRPAPAAQELQVHVRRRYPDPDHQPATSITRADHAHIGSIHQPGLPSSRKTNPSRVAQMTRKITYITCMRVRGQEHKRTRPGDAIRASAVPQREVVWPPGYRGLLLGRTRSSAPGWMAGTASPSSRPFPRVILTSIDNVARDRPTPELVGPRFRSGKGPRPSLRTRDLGGLRRMQTGINTLPPGGDLRADG